MAYTSLKVLYYQNREKYETAYSERFNSEYAHHIDFEIAGNKAFFLITPEIQNMITSIYRTDKRVFALCGALPGKAIEQFSVRCLIDEIVLTNNIEGVHSTRREISEIIDDLKRNNKNARFNGLVQKYFALRSGNELNLNSPEDIRKIYDEIVLPEVLDADPKNMPDGTIFRKESVSVQSRTQKEIHRGVYPEERIIEAMNNALLYLNDDTEDLLYRTAVFHYLLGYIHPFYDGNGRLNRFISSYMLSKGLEPVLGYRLSYTIRENLSKYYDAFKICNLPQNRGDLTPFVEMFLEIISESINALVEALEKRYELRNRYSEQIPYLPGSNEEICYCIYDYLIQAELFSEHGISRQELLRYLNKSGETLRKKLLIIDKAKLLKVEKIKNENYYGIDLKKIDSYIEWKENQ